MTTNDDDPTPGVGQDATLTLAVYRPKNNAEWIIWHANRDRARQHLARIRVIDRQQGEIDPAATAIAQDTITQALGLDPDSEAELLNRWT